MPKPHTAETILNIQAVIAKIGVGGLSAEYGIIAVISAHTVHALIAELGFLELRAVHAITAVKNTVIIETIFRRIARKSHIAIFALLRVLAKGAVFILNALKADMRFFEAEPLEFFEKRHKV